MRATNERLTILSQAEQSALYELPDFDYDQRIEYLTLTEQELVNLIISKFGNLLSIPLRVCHFH